MKTSQQQMSELVAAVSMLVMEINHMLPEKQWMMMDLTGSSKCLVVRLNQTAGVKVKCHSCASFFPFSMSTRLTEVGQAYPGVRECTLQQMVYALEQIRNYEKLGRVGHLSDRALRKITGDLKQINQGIKHIKGRSVVITEPALVV